MTRRDAAVAVAVACVIGLAVLGATMTLDVRFLDPARGNDVWFEGDLARVADDITHRWGAHTRATVHPLFPLLTVLPAYVLRGLGASTHGAVAGVTALSAAVWALAAYVFYRAVAFSRLDAVLLVALSGASAAGQFWLTVPESAALGSASVLLVAAVAARSIRGAASELVWISSVAGSLAVTVSNVAAGVLCAAVALPWRRALQVTANALAVVVVLWAVQRAIVPHADFFVGYSNEQRYLLRDETGGPLNAVRVVTMNGMIMPSVGRWEKPGRSVIMSVQHEGLGNEGWPARFATVLWAAMLGWGLAITTRTWSSDRRFQPVILVLVFELGLYAIYGTESFLYVLSVVPLLVAIAARGLQGDGRRGAQVALVVLLIVAALNNGARLLDARAFFVRSEAAGQYLGPNP